MVDLFKQKRLASFAKSDHDALIYSDHDALIYTRLSKEPKPATHTKRKRSYKHFDKKSFIDDVSCHS